MYAWIRSASSMLALVVVMTLLGGATCQDADQAQYRAYNERISSEMKKVGLGPGDVFEVDVYGEDDLSRTYRVGTDGTIHFPLINRVEVAGLTPFEIEEEIRQRLKEGFMRDPSVSVFVKEYNSKKVFVLGEVARPGTFPYVAGMNIVEAVTLAGGFKASANENYVVVTRRGEDGKEEKIAVPVERITEGQAHNFGLKPGDIIYVPDTLL